MIFALFIILVFAGIMMYVQFGTLPNVATPKAQVLAENMAIFHQAAMLEVDKNAATLTCAGGTTTNCAVPLNNQIWAVNRPRPLSQFDRNWPEYRSMVRITNSSGWQSFLLRGINGLNATVINGTENYVLTVFRGYGGGNATLAAGSEKGKTDESNLTLGMSTAITERSGLGILNCDTTALTCKFIRYAGETNPNGSNGTEQPLSFNPSLFTDSLNQPYFSSSATTVSQILNGKFAMMTRVGN